MRTAAQSPQLGLHGCILYLVGHSLGVRAVAANFQDRAQARKHLGRGALHHTAYSQSQSERRARKRARA
jgi:predicted alpha/beta hydrolase family esterase